MRKILAVILALVMIFCFAACGGEAVETPAGGETPDNGTAGAVGGGATSTTDGGSSQPSGGNNQPSGGNNQPSGGDNQPSGGNNQPSGGSVMGAGYAAARTLNKSGAVSAIDTLANTYYKLTTEKKLKVAYFGGSVTGGIGGTNGYSWTSATTEWLNEKFPGASIDSKNFAWGGTSSFWGYFRMSEDNTGKDNVIAFNPDIIFIEFAINDAYSHLTGLQSNYYMEGIVKKLRAANPKVDIIFVLITDKNKMDKESVNSTAHIEVASHYGIPTIDVGKALVNKIKSTGGKWEDYSGDLVHPNDNGYKIYADCVADNLNKLLIASPDKSGYKDHAKPANDLVSNQSTGSYLIKADSITNQTGFTAINSKSVNCPNLGGKHMLAKQGAKMTVEFEGRGFGFLCDGGTGGKVKVTVDGKSVTVDVLGGDNFEYPAIENLNPGKHTAEIEILSANSKVAIGAFVVEK